MSSRRGRVRNLFKILHPEPELPLLKNWKDAEELHRVLHSIPVSCILTLRAWSKRGR